MAGIDRNRRCQVWTSKPSVESPVYDVLQSLRLLRAHDPEHLGVADPAVSADGDASAEDLPRCWISLRVSGARETALKAPRGTDEFLDATR
jgi:hypothetical protein